MPPLLADALSAPKTAQDAERREWRAEYRDYNLVFTVPGGAPVHPSNLHRRRFVPLMPKAEVPRVCFHDLRHLHATLMLAAGVHPKVVSERLGHAGGGITLDIYRHVLPGLQREAGTALETSLLGGA